MSKFLKIIICLSVITILSYNAYRYDIKAQLPPTVELACPAGFNALPFLTTRNNVTGNQRQVGCVDNLGNIGLQSGVSTFSSSAAGGFLFTTNIPANSGLIPFFNSNNNAVNSINATGVPFQQQGVALTILVGNKVDLTGQTAAISNGVLVPFNTGGPAQVIVTFYAKITTPATTSSTLGGANGFQLNYLDATDLVTINTPAAIPFNTTAANLALNTTQVVYTGVIPVSYANSSGSLLYNFGYTSSGATPMAYEIHIRAVPIWPQ